MARPMGRVALLEAWAARRPELVRVLSQPNGGQGSARNLGLEHATGEWVTFTDPDDMLDRDFFRVVDRFATAHPDSNPGQPSPILFDERTGRMSDTHPRRRQFEAGDRRVDLAREPNTYTGSATTLYRLDRIRESDCASIRASDLDLRMTGGPAPCSCRTHRLGEYLSKPWTWEARSAIERPSA